MSLNCLGPCTSQVFSTCSHLFSLDPFDVDDELLPVTLDNLADLLSLVLAADDLNLIVLTNGHRLDSVLFPQFLVKGGGHQLPPDVGRSLKMPLAVLPPGGAHVGVELHLGMCRRS